jgi:predicted RNase H-like HicB family nuclease
MENTENTSSASTAELDVLRDAYKAAVEHWVAAIREEENLATPDHDLPAVDAWEHAGFSEEEARQQAKQAKKDYEDALRKVNFHF